MRHDAAVELLARMPVFHGLSGELLAVILQSSTITHLRAGTVISRAGMPADAALIILEGTAKLQDAGGREIEQIAGPGAGLCDMAMLIDTSAIHGATAESAVTILSLPRVEMGQLMMAYPLLAAHIERNIRNNLAATADLLVEMDQMLAEPVVPPGILAETQPGNEIAPQVSADLASADLVSADLASADLASADLASADLAFADLAFAERVAPGQSDRDFFQPAPQIQPASPDSANGAEPNQHPLQAPEFLRRPEAVASHFRNLSNRPMNDDAVKLPVHDVMAELQRANPAANQNRPTRERDRTGAPSPAPR